MTAAKAIEYRITRNLLQRRSRDSGSPHLKVSSHRWADRLIAILALTAGLFVLGSFLQELFWVVLAAGTMLTLTDA